MNPVTLANTPQKLRFVIVDGSSYLYRAYNAMPELTNRQGMPTGAIYGVVNMLRKLQNQHQPDYQVIVFDAKGKTFRHFLYSEYKANRVAMPDQLHPQLQPLQAIITAMGWPWLQIPGVEADDVIATLTKQAESAGLQTWIISGDKDFTQLVNDHVTLQDTLRNRDFTPAEVEATFGVKPAQMVDYLALLGDQSDNVPGIPKVGAKTAAKWLKQYGSIANLLAHREAISGTVGDSLRQHWTQLALSQQLVALQCKLTLPLTPLDCVLQPPDIENLRAYFQRFEFHTWLKALPPLSSPLLPLVETSPYQSITAVQDLEPWLIKLQQAPLVALYMAVNSTGDALESSGEPAGLALAITPGSGCYIPFQPLLWSKLQPILENPACLKAGFQLKTVYHALSQQGIHLRGMAYDIGLESYLLDSTRSHTLEALAQHYLNQSCTPYQDLVGRGKKELPFSALPLEQATAYAAAAADMALQLHPILWEKLSHVNPQAIALFTDIEMPLIPILAQMEQKGVLIDAARLQQQGVELTAQLQAIEQQAHTLAGMPFNLESPKQVGDILFNYLQLPTLKKTPGQQASTAESVLLKLAETEPLPRLILDYRHLSKLKSTYIDALLRQLDSQSRIHTSYQQMVAVTGRLSSIQPNLQHIPIRTPEGREIRRAFIAPPGYRLVAADYSQIELRIMAHLSGDAQMIQAFQKGEDIHRATAADIFGVELAAVTPEQRRSAKAINFGLIYGLSAYGLAQQLNITQATAQQYRDAYFARYPQVQLFMMQLQAQAQETGFVSTLYGRRLYLPDIHSPNTQRRQYAQRTAVNAPMQGTAADLIKRAMIRIQAELQRTGLDAHLILQVHDELVFEVAVSQVESSCQLIRDTMSRVATLTVPLVVDIGVGQHWAEAH